MRFKKISTFLGLKKVFAKTHWIESKMNSGQLQNQSIILPADVLEG